MKVTPHIENSERGFTVNKPFAWTLFLAAVGAGFWVATQVSDAQHGIKGVATSIEAMSNRQADDRKSIERNADDIRLLQSTGERIDERLLNIERSQERAEDKQDVILNLLRAGARSTE